MATAQTAYTATPTLGFPGMVANGETSNRISRTVEDVAGIGFGKAVFRGTLDHGVTVTPTEGKFVGFTMIDPAITPVPGGAAADIYPRYETAAIMDQGVLWITAAAVSIADGDPVYITSAGVITNVVGSNIPVPAIFVDTLSAGGLGRIKIMQTLMPAGS